MKKIIYSTAALLLIVLFSSFTSVNSMISEKKLLGNWEYSIPDAPYEYQTGELIFKNTDNGFGGHTLVSGYETVIEDISIDGDKVSFKLFTQGVEVTFDLIFSKNAFMGTVSYTEGKLTIAGKKKV